MVRVVARLFVSTDIDCLVVQRQVVGKCVVIELMVTAREILIEKNLPAIVVPVLHQRIAMSVDQDVVGELAEDVDLVLRPHNFVAALKVFLRVLGSQPAMSEFLPARFLPDGFVCHAVYDRRDSLLWGRGIQCGQRSGRGPRRQVLTLSPARRQTIGK